VRAVAAQTPRSDANSNRDAEAGSRDTWASSARSADRSWANAATLYRAPMIKRPGAGAAAMVAHEDRIPGEASGKQRLWKAATAARFAKVLAAFEIMGRAAPAKDFAHRTGRHTAAALVLSLITLLASIKSNAAWIAILNSARNSVCALRRRWR
jgi:hypothetical protein